MVEPLFRWKAGPLRFAGVPELLPAIWCWPGQVWRSVDTLLGSLWAVLNCSSITRRLVNLSPGDFLVEPLHRFPMRVVQRLHQTKFSNWAHAEDSNGQFGPGPVDRRKEKQGAP